MLSLIENVRGCSGSDLTISVNNFAGIAIFILRSDSIDNLVDKEVSKSEEVIFNLLLSISNKKLSKMGNVLLVFNIVPSTCKLFNKSELEMIKFIFVNIFYLIYYLKLNY